jgi:hypothetical protein
MFVSSVPEENASAAVDHTLPASAAYQTDAGSTSNQRHGAIAAAALPAGPTWWRRVSFG